jgi:hypothetical protein
MREELELLTNLVNNWWADFRLTGKQINDFVTALTETFGTSEIKFKYDIKTETWYISDEKD